MKDYLHYIKTHPGFPKPGVLFYDLGPLCAAPVLLQALTADMAKQVANIDFDIIVGIESRGFIFGAMLALFCQKGFVMIRKAGKLPGQVEEVQYDLEYASSRLELQQGVIQPGQKVLIVDDVLATGGTARAAMHLLQKAKAEVAACLFVLEIEALKGKNTLDFESIYSLIRV